MGVFEVVGRAELARRIARSLLMFPLYPQPGDTIEQHVAALETCFTLEITKLLNEAAKDNDVSRAVVEAAVAYDECDKEGNTQLISALWEDLWEAVRAWREQQVKPPR